jgi:polyisoprenyl-phosphate glycosyltransferase
MAETRETSRIKAADLRAPVGEVAPVAVEGTGRQDDVALSPALKRCPIESVSAKATPRVCIVVPCYNEEEVLPETARRLDALLTKLISSNKILADSQVIFVDDGSRDRTWSLIKELNHADPRIRGVKLSANRGHQTALIAGLFAANGDAVISIDADLQDDVSAIELMIDAYVSGYEIVYGVRKRRETDTVFKRTTAQAYYTLLNLLGVKIVFNHADYRLLGRRALESLQQYTEVNLFIRGIVPLIGFRCTTVQYDRAGRFAGESKYPLKKMLALAIDGVTSFTAFPLRLIALLGLIVSAASVLMVVWVLWIKLFTTSAIPGWASSVIPIYFLGGIQLLSIGVLGEYVAKIYFETKRRPRYFIEETL